MQVVCQGSPTASLTAGSLTGGEKDGVRYSRAGIEMRRPREQPPFPTEFVSLVRARGGQVAGLVRRPARNATWANVGGPVANGPGPQGGQFRLTGGAIDPSSQPTR